MKINGVLFDLDGTLIDTIDLIVRTYQHTLRECLQQELSQAEIVQYFGLTLRESMEHYTTPERVEELCAVYRAYNLANHDALIRPITGVEKMLLALQQRRIKIAVVTSKKVAMAWRGLKCFNLDKYVETVIGCDICVKHKPDPEPMYQALTNIGLTGAECLCVGDSPFDLQSGKAAGCLTAAVRYTSFEWAAMLAQGKPDYIAEQPADLVKIIDTLNETEGV